MKILVLSCLISIIPAILCAPDDGCPMCEFNRNPTRCGANCPDDQIVNQLREGVKKLSSQSSILNTINGDSLCIKFSPKSGLGIFDEGVTGFVVNNGRYIPLKDLIGADSSKQGIKKPVNSPLDDYRDRSNDAKQVLKHITGLLIGRDGWGDLRPPFG